MMGQAVLATRPESRVGRRLADFLALTKPRVVLMVLVTGWIGFYLASPGPPEVGRLLHLLVGLALAAAGTLALNQYLERDVDARMARTRRRPLPAGRLRPAEALAFGSLLSVAGIGHLGLWVGGPAALLTLLTLVSYLFVYTPLKRRSPLCLLLGAIPGALPPVTGWVAARGELGAGAWVLFGILFLWQLPHTLAIASLYRSDYACAELMLAPLEDAGGRRTRRQIVADCAALLLMGLLPGLIGMAGTLYLVGALTLGVGFLGCGIAAAISRSAADARRLLLASLVYLPALLALMAIDRLPL